MVAPLTPKPTRKAEALAKAPPTIASSREEDAALKEVALPRYRCANIPWEEEKEKIFPEPGGHLEGRMPCVLVQ
jgi:hypothetical protein